MKILLTGALGYIGSETLLRFTNRPDITVYAIDNDITALRDRGSYFARFSNIKIINCDVTDWNQVTQLPSADIVVHLAATVGYLTASFNPDLTHNTNVVGTKNIAQLGISTMFFSTGSVYGKIGDACNELVPVNPQTVYAQTKYLGESIVQSNPYVIFRPATAFGVSFKMRHDLIIHDLINQAVHNGHIELYQPGARRSFYSVQKLAELIEYACDRFDLFQNNLYNVGCESGNVMKKDIVDLLKQQVNFTCTLVDGADADNRDYNVNYDKLKSVWPAYNENFSTSIPNIVEYYKQW
jgi:nucleoside-diphosphate-sugar epimerase